MQFIFKLIFVNAAQIGISSIHLSGISLAEVVETKAQKL